MTDQTPQSDKNVEALLDIVTQHQNQQCRQIDDEAAIQAAEIIRSAHHDAREKVHQVIVEERHNAQRAIAKQRAQIETENRQNFKDSENHFLDQVWEHLSTALNHRWTDPKARREWLSGTLEHALKHLQPGPWTITHPLDWSAAEIDAYLDQIRVFSGSEPTFAPDADLPAGVRIQANNVTADASPRGLLANHQDISAMLLAELFTEDGS
jgi:hypothetical protein